MLVAAGLAPGRPDVEQPDLAAHVGGREALARFLQQWERERGRGLADQRRGHFARITLEADSEKADQQQENGQWPEELLHAVRTSVASSVTLLRCGAR
jgi:hypothetical protein